MAGGSLSGMFTLEELELLRTGPVSIKRRVHMLGGELMLDSRAGRRIKFENQVPPLGRRPKEQHAVPEPFAHDDLCCYILWARLRRRNGHSRQVQSKTRASS
jgi:hypothetical protein